MGDRFRRVTAAFQQQLQCVEYVRLVIGNQNAAGS
jgi:hypothetical protein